MPAIAGSHQCPPDHIRYNRNMLIMTLTFSPHSGHTLGQRRCPVALLRPSPVTGLLRREEDRARDSPTVLQAQRLSVENGRARAGVEISGVESRPIFHAAVVENKDWANTSRLSRGKHNQRPILSRQLEDGTRAKALTSRATVRFIGPAIPYTRLI
jgi:hypothetical protein